MIGGWSWYEHVRMSTTETNKESSGTNQTVASSELGLQNLHRNQPEKSQQKTEPVTGQDNATDSGSMPEAQALIDSGAFEQGAAILEGIVRREPHNTQAMMELAMVYTLDFKSPTKARQILEKIIDVNPDHRAALNELELVYNELGAQTDGLAVLQLKTEQHPDARELQFVYGRMLAASDPEAALPWLQRATEIPDSREQAFNELALAAVKAGKTQIAIDAWIKAITVAESELEQAKAGDKTGIDFLEERIAATKNELSKAQKQLSRQ